MVKLLPVEASTVAWAEEVDLAVASMAAMAVVVVVVEETSSTFRMFVLLNSGCFAELMMLTPRSSCHSLPDGKT